jgi:hypothetical protein
MSRNSGKVKEYQNLIQINLEASEDTRDSFLENLRENSSKKCYNYKSKEFSNSFLEKKVKRNRTKQNKKNSKDNNSKNKIIQKILNDFKLISPFYKEFNLFTKIEKNVKNYLYTHYSQLAKDIRNIFSHYFFSYSNNYEKYNKTLQLSENFEKVYKDYENKLFIKESKIHIDIKNRFNKLRKQFRASLNHNQEYINNTPNSIKNSSKENYTIKSENYNNKNLKKYKINLAKKIRNLTSEQKKGIIKIISNHHLDKNNTNNVMELDVNKLPENELKLLEKYVNKCAFEKENSSETNTNNIIPEDEEMFNDLSESISSDEDGL